MFYISGVCIINDRGQPGQELEEANEDDLAGLPKASHGSSNKGIATSKKLLVVAPGITTSSKKLFI